MRGNETMKCRKVKAVLRFYTPQKTLHPEKHFHHLQLLYFPWRDESELIGSQGTYASKFSDAYVKRIVHNSNTV